jgi:alpha-tubulin suppressor-like RCC1 family protein
VQVAAGYAHTLGLKSDGTVVCTGVVDVSGWTGIVQVAAGGGFTVGLKANGTVVTTNSTIGGDVSGWNLY